MEKFEYDMKTVDGMFVKQIVLPSAGTVVPQHKHKWDHTTLLATGTVIVWEDDKIELPRLYRAPAIIFIGKDVFHKFQSLSDGVLMYCLHNLHGADVVQVLEENDLTDWEIDVRI